MKKVRLGDVCKIQAGYAFKSKEFQKNNIPVIRIGNVQDRKVIIDENIGYTKEFLSKHPEFEVKYGDILIALSGATVGKIGKYQERRTALLNQRVGKFVTTDKMDERYLYFLLQSPLFESFILNNAFGCAQPNISNKTIEEFQFFHYEKTKQIEIANKLDKIQEVIDLKTKQIEELEGLIKSQFAKMFGNIKTNDKKWKYCDKIGNLCVLNPKKNELENMGDIEVSFIPMQNVSERGEIDTKEIRLLNDVKKGFTYFKENDILFAKITPCMENGKGAIAIGLKNSIGFGSTEFHVIRPKEKINSIWLYTYTSLRAFRIEAEMKMIGSAGQKRVPIKFFENYKIAVPPIKLQNQFACIVQKINQQKEDLRTSLQETKKLQESIMNQYFG